MRKRFSQSVGVLNPQARALLPDNNSSYLGGQQADAFQV
jgi:hypothetical protein